MTRRAAIAGLAVAAAGLFLAAADAYAVAALLPRMLADIGLPVDEFQQATTIISGFLAGYVVALPLLGTMADQQGRLPVFVAGLVVFGAGSVLTATAPDLGWLLAGRAVQGLGGGALVPATLALAADVFVGPARDRVIGAVSAVQEAGSVVGPVYGAAVAGLVPNLGWRFVFWLNLPLALVIGGALAVGWRRRGPAVSVQGRREDLISAASLGLGLGALVLALYPDRPDASPVSLWFWPLFAVALALLMLYGWRQRRDLPHLLNNRPFLGSLVANLLVGGGLMVVLVDVPVFARGIFNVDQGRAGLLLTFFLAGVPVGAVAGGWVAARIGRRPVAGAGMLAAACLFLVLAGWNAGSLGPRAGPFRVADVELFGLGLAFGVVIAPIASAALGATDRDQHGLVSSLVVTARTVGMLLALSALTAFGLYRFRQLLAGQPPPPVNASLHDRLKALENNVTQSLVLEYHEIFRLAAVLCLAAGLVAVFSLGARPPHAAGRD